MKVIVAENHEEVSRLAADILEETVRTNPCCTLGLATGSSPVGMYRELSRRCREEGLDFSRVHSVNLDEYVGLAPTHEQSYRYFMDSNLFDHINIDKANTYVAKGTGDAEENLREFNAVLDHTLAGDYLRQFTYPWEALAGIGDMISALGAALSPDEYDHPEEGVWVARDAKVYPTAYLGAPCIIGHKTEVRPGAFIRGKALVGDNCVVGNSTELKNVILFDNVQVPHYNYVGDSILGYKSHMGAGSITSNVKSDKLPVVIHNEGEEIETGRKKVGAMLGDYVEVGCNSVLNPGTVIGRDASVYPTSCVRGVVPERCIYKAKGNIAVKK